MAGARRNLETGEYPRSTGRRKVRPVLFLVLALALLLAPVLLELPGFSSGTPSAALAQEVPPTDPAPTDEDPADDEDPAGGAEENKTCDASGVSDSFAGGILSPGEDFDTAFTVCPLENYYLQYVDFSTVNLDPTKALGYAPRHALNNLASIVFEFNAKFVYYAIAVLNYVLEFDLVDELKEPTETVIDALGEGFFKVWLPAMYGLAVVYGAYLSLWRGQVAEGFGGLLKAGVIGALGVWLIVPGNAGTAVEFHNVLTGALTNTAFCAVGSVNPEAKASGDLGSGARCTVDGSGINAQIWTRYVYEPWQLLQISESDPEKAKEHADAVLAEADPDAREAKLKEVAGVPTGLGGAANDLYKGATGNPGAGDEDITNTTSFIHSSKHLTGAILMFAMSILFVVLLGFVSVLLLVSELMVLILILTSMVWMLPAVYPGSSIAWKVFNWLVDETVQIFAYKLLIGIYLLIIGLIFAADWGLGTVFLLNGALALATYRFRDKIKRLAQPGGGLMRGVRDTRGVHQGANPLERAHRQGGHHAPGGAADATVAGGAGGGAGGRSAQATRPQGSALRHAAHTAAAGGFMPEVVAAAAAGYARHAPVDAYRNTRGRVGSAVDRLQEEEHAPAATAARLDRLAAKRKEDPHSLNDAERAELENAEAMLACGKDPTSRTSLAARRNQKAAREEFRKRKALGLSREQQLAGPRKTGESEAEYLARQKAARAEAKSTRDKVRGLRDHPEQRGLWPSKDGPHKPREDDDRSRTCASCGKPFLPESKGVTICPECRGPKSSGNAGKGPGDENTTRRFRDRTSGGTGDKTSEHENDRTSERTAAGERRGPLWEPGGEHDTQSTRPNGDRRREAVAGDGEAANAASYAAGKQARRPEGAPTADEESEEAPGQGGQGSAGARKPDGAPSDRQAVRPDATGVRRGGDEHGDDDKKEKDEPSADGSAGSPGEKDAAPAGPVREIGAQAVVGSSEPQALRPESPRSVPADADTADADTADADTADEPGLFSEERARVRMRAAEEVREAGERGKRIGAAYDMVAGAEGGGPAGAVGAGKDAVAGPVEEGGKAQKENLRRAVSGVPSNPPAETPPDEGRKQARRPGRQDAGMPPADPSPSEPDAAPTAAPTAEAGNAASNASEKARGPRAEEEAVPGPKQDVGRGDRSRAAREAGRGGGSRVPGEGGSGDSAPSGRQATRPEGGPGEARRTSTSGRLPLREAKPARGGDSPGEASPGSDDAAGDKDQ